MSADHPKPTGKIYGWFDGSDHAEPAYDPRLAVPCLICGNAVNIADVRTISMMGVPETHPERSYFYRLHRTCHEALSEPKRSEIDGVVWDAIAHNGD